MILTFARKLLEREGHEVMTAADGFEALNVLSDFIPDVIFFDLIMPKIDGDKLIQIIRNMPRLKDSFLVIVSAVVGEVDFDFQATGADYYIAKGPFSAMAENIIAAIKASEAPRVRDIPKPVVGLEHTTPGSSPGSCSRATATWRPFSRAWRRASSRCTRAGSSTPTPPPS